ncbi:Gibberellin cluster GA4 desaturase [Colletotrichum gloeosporioides]|uniref:Gibberellin cluster GA4 desaturase n=1 Tax=Colletotrichum gloeosporioides TaxID=474922 RepID=A0A8H4C9J9_COLGL|nr:Gibberellin cluster GA4 desaturase [Colletotrichum gloeosporioides]KAF3799963.1 Gibberellin cluster GA4 desaturase [Colletotrichum gloeosporioides]
MPHVTKTSESVLAYVNCHLPPAKGEKYPVQYIATVGFQRAKYDKQLVNVTDSRTCEDDFKLDTHGFQWVESTIQEKQWDGDYRFGLPPQLQKDVQDLLKRHTGATYVHPFAPHVIRRDSHQKIVNIEDDVPDDAMLNMQPPAMFVHVDQSYDGAQIILDRLPEAEMLRAKTHNRWGIINVWQPLKPVNREPLAVCDARSVDESDLVPVTTRIVIGKPPNTMNKDNEQWHMKASPKHKWYYASNMTTDEALLIKCFDSKMGSNEQPNRLLAYNIYVYKKPDMDEQSHHHHLEHVNSPIITSLLKKYGAVSYSVTHNDSTSKAAFKRLFPNAPEAMLLDYDSVISMIVPNIECIEKMREDPDFMKKFIPDHFNFADMSRSRCIVGWVENYNFQNGLNYATKDELAFLDTDIQRKLTVSGDTVEYKATAEVDKEKEAEERAKLDAIDNHNVSAYTVTLNYRLDPRKGGDEMIWGGTFAQMRRKYDPREVVIQNARGKESEFSLDKTGFQFEHFPTSYKDFPWSPIDEHLNKVYNAECEEFMRKITGASDVRLISHIIRQRQWEKTDPEEEAKKPDMAMTDGGLLSARFVHIDQSDLGAIRRLYDDMPPGEGAKHDGKHRWAIINLWRPWEQVHREPLALCDARSVRDDELHDTMHCVPFQWPRKPTENHMWQIAPPESSTQHKWWFRSGMTRDDVILIKIFDSKKDGRARRTPHSAFPTPDDIGPARRSIETRFFVFWEDESCE